MELSDIRRRVRGACDRLEPDEAKRQVALALVAMMNPSKTPDMRESFCAVAYLYRQELASHGEVSVSRRPERRLGLDVPEGMVGQLNYFERLCDVFGGRIAWHAYMSLALYAKDGKYADHWALQGLDRGLADEWWRNMEIVLVTRGVVNA